VTPRPNCKIRQFWTKHCNNLVTTTDYDTNNLFYGEEVLITNGSAKGTQVAQSSNAHH